MKITFISDTHGKHHEMTHDLPGGPILVHCGDVSSSGSKREVEEFFKWFDSLPYGHKILISGNHDFFFDYKKGTSKFSSEPITKERIDELLAKYPDIHYLDDSGVTIEGIKFWGSPITPWFYEWAFNRTRETIKEHWDLIPNDTQILLTHGPSYGFHDKVIRGNERVGCPILIDKIRELKPTIHAFGHIHEDFGMTLSEETLFINASMLDLRYDYTNEPTVIDYEELLKTIKK